MTPKRRDVGEDKPAYDQDDRPCWAVLGAGSLIEIRPLAWSGLSVGVVSAHRATRLLLSAITVANLRYCGDGRR